MESRSGTYPSGKLPREFSDWLVFESVRHVTDAGETHEVITDTVGQKAVGAHGAVTDTTGEQEAVVPYEVVIVNEEEELVTGAVGA